MLYLRWSYSRLWDESGQVATLLQRRGLTKGDQVILWGPNSPHWVLIFFGCLRAGVIIVPLDLRSAPDYVERVASRTEPKLAFTSRFTPKGDVDLGVPEVTFEELEAAIAGLPQPEHVDIQPDDLAEIMFTSGTTGDPKGVMLTHRNLTANIAGVSRYISCDPSSRLLSILPLSHMPCSCPTPRSTNLAGLPIARHPTPLPETSSAQIIPRLHKNQALYVQSRREEIGCQSETRGTLTLADRKAQFSRSVHGARMMAAMPLCPRRSYQRAFASRSSSFRV